MADVDNAYQYGRYEKIWLKSYMAMFNIKDFETQTATQPTSWITTRQMDKHP